MSPIGTLHFTEPTIYKAQKALIAAKFNGIALNQKKFEADKDAKKPDFLAKNPTGKVPYLETDMGCIFTSNAVARYVARCRADTPIYGKTFADEGQIDTWMEFCVHEIEVPLMTWVYPCMGLMVDVPAATANAQADVRKALTKLEEQLKGSTFLIGDCVSLADIAVVCALSEGFNRVFDPAYRKPFPKVCAWYETCRSLPQFKTVLGDVKNCAQAEKPKAPPAAKAKAEPKSPKAEPKAKAEPKSPKAEPKKEPAKAAPAPAAAAGGGDVDAQVKAVGDELRAVKEKLKGEGLSGKKLNDHDDVKALVAKLTELKSAAAAAPAAAAPAAAPAAAAPKSPKQAPAQAPAAAAGGDVEAQIKAVGDEVRVLKERLKGEGITGKKLNDHDEVKALVAKLTELKAAAAPAAAAPAAKPASPKAAPKAAPASPKAAPASPKAAPAAAGAGDIEAQVKAVGDEVRVLKEKLKGEGLSGKKLNEHPEIKELVAKLQDLKAKLPA